MVRIRTVGVVLGFWLLFTVCSAAEVVTNPLRRFGFGDLLKVAVSPTGEWMATSGGGGAFLWDLQSGTMVHRLEAHHARVQALCFSSDGQVLLTGGGDWMIRAWEVNSGREIRTFEGHIGEIFDVSFAPDGHSFVSVGDRTVRVWSFATGELLHTLMQDGLSFNRAMFATSNRLVTANGWITNSVRVWDLATEQTIHVFGDLVQTIALTAGGHLVTASERAVQVWNIDTGELIRPLPGAAKHVVGLITFTNTPHVIGGYQNGHAITWDASTGDIQHEFMGETLVSLAAIPGTNQILTGHPGGLVRVKNNQTGDNLRVFGGHTTSVTTGVGFSADGRFVVSGGTEVFTRLWNRTNAQQVMMFPGHGAGTATVSFSPDGSRVLTTFGAPIFSAQLWNVQTGFVEREFFGHTGWLLDAAFSPNGQRIATAAQDGTARLWDIASGTQIRMFNSAGTWVHCVAVSSNGTMLASGGSDGIARVWNTANGQLMRTFPLNAGSVVDVAFSPATQELLVAWSDGFIRVFDATTGELKLDHIAPAAFLHAAIFSPDGRFILAGEGWPFFTARLWDARNGEELRVFAGHGWPVSAVAFNALGSSILTGADIVRLWDISDIAARLEHSRKPNGLELRWNAGTLQHSQTLDGPWLDVTNAVTSPWLVPMDQTAAFFRTKIEKAE